MGDTPRVTFALTEEQEMLRQTTRQFLADRVSPTVVRDLMETETGFDAALWQSGAELGWHSLAIPEEYGGAGYTFAELSVVLEEMGRALFPGPFLSTVVMAANAILIGGSDSQKKELLPGIAMGESVMTMALFEGSHGAVTDDIRMTAAQDGGDWVLDGVKKNVLFGHVAGTIVTAARTPNGLSLFLVPADAGGLSAEHVPTLDAIRKQATVTFAGVRLGPEALLGSEGTAGDVIDQVLRLASVALSLEQVGGAQWCLETSVEHGQTRFQFGRAIGSFQAIKHRLADMLVSVEHAKSTAYHAARIVDDATEMLVAAPLAKSVCSEAYLGAASDTIQILGGTGFTWEHDTHLYFKRAKSTSLMFGGVRHQRRLLAEALGL
ncbi:MAG: acyl-CoA/acyl-ACP dehydrogenase [Acidimicrobiia bacterium]|nr:acyl-CoA/acyl-ACP dehydrogenase [Acidimicrobiia bacterium]